MATLMLDDNKVDKTQYEYPAMTKTLGGFKLSVSAGLFKPSTVMMMLG